MLIKVKNNLTEGASKTFLTNSEAAGTNVIRWKNAAGFSASWGIQIGETGEEQTEVMLLSNATPAGTAGTLTANTSFEHPVDTPVYAIKFNQVVFERSTAGTAGTATPMTNGTVTVQGDSDYTVFDDTAGSASYAYRTFYKSSVLGLDSSESDWITPAGFSFYSLAKIRERIKNKMWNSSKVTNDEIDDWINEWKDEMVNAVIKVNEDYALGTVGVAFNSNGLGTISTADFVQPRRVWINYTGTQKYESTKMNINDFTPDQVYSSVTPYHAFQGDSVFLVKPSESGGTAEFVFYRFGTTMVNDTDELPPTMRSFTKSFVDYGLSQSIEKGAITADLQNKADKYFNRAIASKTEFISFITPRDKSGPQYIDLVEPIEGDQPVW